jgi:VanZ like family
MVNINFSAKTFLVLTIAWAICILIATLTSSGIFEEFHLLGLFGYDKPIHFIMFAMQAWLLAKTLTKNNTKNYMILVMLSCLSSALYGVLTEVLQGIFVWLGRGFDYDDMIADALGCLIVLALFWTRRKQFAQ